MKKTILPILALLLASCKDNAPVPATTEYVPPPQSQPAVVYFPEGKVPQSARFLVASYGSFYGGFQNNQREIFVVTDTKTGASYLAITGCGTTELRTETHTTGKVTTTKTIEE